MNIFVRELKANLKALIIWGVIVILFVVLGLAKFSAYANNPEMLAVLNGLPAPALAAFNLKAFNLTTVTGFYGIMFTYYALLLCIAAVMWGSDIVTKEERDKTVEFSLTLPVTRGRVVTGKALAALVNCVGLLLITWGASVVGAAPYQPDAAFYSFLTICMAALFVLQLVFLSIGLLLGCAVKQYRQVTSLAIGVLLATYFLSVVVTLSKDLDFLKYLTPFRYFDPVAMLNESRLDAGFVGLSFVIVVACMVGAYWTYARRDLYI
jgi:ABC-2 type transport system permease protein